MSARPRAAVLGLQLASALLLVLAGLGIGAGGAGWVIALTIVLIGSLIVAIRPLWGLYLAVALIPLESAGRIMDGVDGLTYAKVALFVCMAGTLAQMAGLGEKLRLPRGVGALYLMVLAALLGSGLHWTRSGITDIVALVGQVVMVVLIYHLVRDDRQYRGLLGAVIVGSIPVVIIGVIESLTGTSLLGTVAVQYYADAFLGLRRITSTFYDPNALGRYLVFALAVTLSARHLIHERGMRLALLVLAALHLYCIAFTFSRGAFLGLAGVIIAFVLWDARLSRRVGSLLLAVCAGALVTVLGQPLLVALVSRFGDRGSLLMGEASRLMIWRLALSAISESPLVGYGPGGATVAAVGVQGAVYSAHNLLIESMLAVGFIGTFAFLLFGWAKTKAVLGGRTSRFSDECRSAVLGLLGVLLTGLTLHSFQSNELWLSLGLLAVVAGWLRSPGLSESPVESVP